MRKRSGFIDEKWRLHFTDAKAKAQEGQVSHPSPHGYLVQCSGFEPRACKQERGLQLTTSSSVLWA